MKLLLGGSPCTYWSVAQSPDKRETTAEGLGWELFKNFLIARDKFQPDYFLYENNKSMSKEIKAQITAEFGFEPVLINSALVSAQNRHRLYWLGQREADGSYSKVVVEQPEDRGILLRDVLDGNVDHEVYDNEDIFEPWGAPIKVGCMPSPSGEIKNSQALRIYSTDGKAVNQVANGGGLGAKTGLYAVPVDYNPPKETDVVITDSSMRCARHDKKKSSVQGTSVIFDDAKAKTLTAAHVPMCFTPVACRCRGRNGEARYECRSDEKANTLDTNTTNGSMVVMPLCVAERGRYVDGKTEQHLEPRLDGKSNTLTTVQKDNMVCEAWDGKTYPVYEVKDGKITIKGKTYPIKLLDGYYIIRKLSVAECMRLQTVPEWYEFPISNSQAYKCLGNGWTVEVIRHLLRACDGMYTEPVDVLSMYDGMACAHIALNEEGIEISRYRATEIDKYAIQAACHNFPDIIQLGDAFAVSTVDDVMADTWE